MLAGALGEARETGAVELHAIDVEADRTALRPGEVNILTVGAVDVTHFPFAVRHLPHQRPGRVVVIDVAVAAALRLPEEAAIRQPRRRSERIDPRFRGLVQDRLRGAVA